MNKKLKGEFVSFEVRNDKNEVIGIDVFYSGILSHSWRNEGALPINADMQSRIKVDMDGEIPIIRISHRVTSKIEGDVALGSLFNAIGVDYTKGGQKYLLEVTHDGCIVYDDPGKSCYNNYTLRPTAS